MVGVEIVEILKYEYQMLLTDIGENIEYFIIDRDHCYYNRCVCFCFVFDSAMTFIFCLTPGIYKIFQTIKTLYVNNSTKRRSLVSTVLAY